MTRSLRALVRSRYRQDLSPEQLAVLKAAVGRRRGEGAGTRPSLGAGLAVALVVLASFVLGLLLHGRLDPMRLPDPATLISGEVARNHLKHEPVQVYAGTFQELASRLDELDFQPVASDLLARLDLHLEGGRYCSVQGLKAAQLRLSPGKDNAPYRTLYEVEYRPDVFGPIPVLDQGEPPFEGYAKGVRVLIWREKGLLFALAGG